MKLALFGTTGATDPPADPILKWTATWDSNNFEYCIASAITTSATLPGSPPAIY